MEYVSIPKDLIAKHRYVILVADVIFINGTFFSDNYEQGGNLITVEHT